MKKEINVWVWNPANSLFKQKKTEKAIGHIIYCECPEMCELHAKGCCLAYDNNIVLTVVEDVSLDIQEWQANSIHG